ncbi:hypothetical protein RhiirA1_464437 [Rhizophagus irregularis]|uniref:Reverse transcriptase domain-containing protein n=1 Tax=Rhizophagus irregularis TaxID=588596 RepID=A0A2N0RI12_9GLOM|nr:hypothetical protein RhiirA1_464437 [Rhizophagus irregularis]
MEDLSLTIPDYIDRSNQEINDQNLNGPLEYNTEYMRDRHSRVLVNGELSEAYYIEDGIDQGEAWSPIIIMENVYDPLLTKLESVRLNTEYELDYAKISLQQNLVEKKKNNNDNENTVKEIGFWESFSYKDDRKVYVRKVTMMVEVFCAQTRWSKLTDKILISLWNTVMIPAIEYHLQAVVLMERECENILAKVNKIFKHSCNLAIGCLNAIIYDRDILKAEQKSIDYLKENDPVSKKSIHYMMEDSEVYDDNDSPWRDVGKVKRTGMEDVEEADFLIWLDHICTNKKNFIWENFNALVNGKRQTLGSVEIKLMTRYKKIEKILVLKKA